MSLLASLRPCRFRGIASLCLLSLSGLAVRGADPTPAPGAATPPAAAPAEAGTGAVESQRERNRVLQKRNPIASEYQVPGELGFAPGAIADGESVDFRSLLPVTGTLLGGRDSTQVGVTYLYHSGSERAEPGFTASVRRSSGDPARATAILARVNQTAAERVVDTALWNWNPTAFTVGGEPVYYLERPRMQSDRIETRTRSALIHVEHRLAPQHVVHAQIEGWDYRDFFRRDMLEYRLSGGTALPGLGDGPQTGTTITDGAWRNARLRRVATEEAVDRERLRFQLGGDLELGEWTVDYDLYHGHWREHRDQFWATFDNDGYDLGYRVGKDPYFPEFRSLNGTSLEDSSQSRFRDSRPSINTTRDVDWAGRVDAGRSFIRGETRYTMSVGALHREKERVKELIKKDVFLRNDAALLPIDGIRVPGPAFSFLQDRYRLPRSVNLDVLRAMAATGHPTLARDDALSILDGLPDNYQSEEIVDGGYLTGSARRGAWTLEAGLRGERTETTTLGTVIVPVAFDAGVGDILAEVNNRGERIIARAVPTANRYGTWLPTLALAYRPAAAWSLRTSYYEQLMRPQYFDIVNYRIIRTGQLQVDEGNPDLAPTDIRTLSLAADYRSPIWGNGSVELYRIAVDKFFYTAQKPEYIENTLYNNKRVENGGAATLQGFQAQWSRAFTSFGLSLEPALAYTYSDSEATVPTRPTDRLTLPQRSRHLLQAGVEWSRGRIGGTAELSYQGVALDEVGPGADRDIYRDRAIAVDASVWWQFHRIWRASLAAQNLTDHPERSYEGVPTRAVRNEYLATTWTLGVRGNF